MNQITIKFGIEDLQRSVPNGTTIKQVVRDGSVKAILGYSDNVRVLISGIAQSLESEVPQGATLELETAANEKA